MLNQGKAACDLCFDGESITRPEYILGLTDPIPVKTCGDLAELLLFVDEADDACTTARAASALCGCPHFPPGACTICGSQKMTMPLQNLDGLVDLGELDFLGLTPTCALVDSGIKIFNNESNGCLDLPMTDLQLYCGCLSGTEDPGASDACSLCPGGEIVPDSSEYAFAGLELTSDITVNDYPDRVLCKDAEMLTKGEKSGSDLCNDIQRGSTACGCPVPDNACQLCPGGKAPLLSTERVDSIFGPGLLCFSLHHQVHQYRGNSTECQTLVDSYAETCGCVKEVEIVPCTLCPNGEPVKFPQKTIVGAEGMGFDHIEHTCGAFEQLAVLVDEKDRTCFSVRTLAKSCGCAVHENACSICQDGTTFSNPTGEYEWLFGTMSFPDMDFKGRKFRCEFADSFMSVVLDADDSACYWNQLMRGTSCGCSGSINTEVKSLVWTQRCSGLLSLIGSMAIIIVALTKKAKDRWNTYNQLVLSISVFDALSSIAYIFGSALTPASLGLYGSIGNDLTCSFQGWLFQAGIISVYYSVILCIYFILIVKYSWTERKFKKVRKWVHLGVLAIGISMSLAVMPYVTVDWRLCYVSKPPILQSWLPSIVFFLLPVGMCLLGMTLLMAFFVKFVREVESKTSSSRFSRGDARSRRSLTTRTFWQSLYFLAAFYTVWPIQFIAFIVPVAEHNSWLYLLAALFGPRQGFLNALVFFCRDGKSIRRGFQRRFKIGRKGGATVIKDKETNSSQLRWEHEFAGKCESPILDNSHKLSQMSPHSVESTEQREPVSLQVRGTSNETNSGRLQVPPEGYHHDDADNSLFTDEDLETNPIDKPDGPMQVDETFEGEAILEYAINAGLLDESECRHFDKTMSAIEIR